MKTLLVTLRPLTAFATPPHGDTLFGQLCWALCNRFGAPWLVERLDGYLQGKPFLVVSDLFPSGHWPRPFVPPHLLEGDLRAGDRKKEKKRIWFPWRDDAGWRKNLSSWGRMCRDEAELWGEERKNRPQPHNQINRLTGTTGTDGFAPFAVTQTWFPERARLEVWVLYDPKRLNVAEITAGLMDVGSFGFGKDASTGLGRFDMEKTEECPLPRQPDSNAWLTLGFCAPQGCGFDGKRSYYQPFTRFGRHGDHAARTGQPFKNPILLARAGAIWSPSHKPLPNHEFVGRGLGGEEKLSKILPATVHQGYAPVVGIHLPEERP
ncbi:MAG: CRISPR-associated protein Csm7 [Magnetococcales bacterium]|nr:CRISPR-associated protein Csm7 [Magnetococcales bacterium]